MRPRELAAVLWTAARRWFRGDPAHFAAAIAFNSVLSVAPLLLLFVAAAGRVLGRDEARERLLEVIERFAGAAAVPVARPILDAAAGEAGLLGSALGVLVMAHFGSAVFRELKFALDRIWDVTPRTTLRGALADWAFAYLMVPAAVFATVVVLALSLFGATVAPLVSDLLPAGVRVAPIAAPVVSFVVLALLLAFVYRHVPSVPLGWSDVAGGALLTAALLLAGNQLIGAWMSRSLLVGLYGAAGALIVLLLWVFYGAQILLFGAHLARAWTERFGSLVRATESAD